ncbi:hypothetical protein GIW81_02340 [Hyphomicrobium sp. xq]|uniref:Uncharacterized protein n=1 Tax=Hyphomicrobium album TaxID=2665159 RepID=A0A6I3KGQ8_9HYPH|nr:hypothetical protein [Hyphomicrobium album]MTD93170.1 hypothetical protein [Hyphomicrobium album]
MAQFLDLRTEQVYLTRFHQKLTGKVCVAAHEVMHLLIAARSLQDVGVIGRIHRLKVARFGLHAEGRWFVTFVWDDLSGAHSLLLERLKIGS